MLQVLKEPGPGEGQPFDILCSTIVQPRCSDVSFSVDLITIAAEMVLKASPDEVCRGPVSIIVSVFLLACLSIRSL